MVDVSAEFSQRNFKQLAEAVSAIAGWHKIQLRPVQVEDAEATIATLYFEDQRDGTWTQTYLIGYQGVARLK